MKRGSFVLSLLLVAACSRGGGGSGGGGAASTGPDPLLIATSSLPGGTVGTGYSASLASTGGTAPVTWSLAGGSLPAGLTLSTAGFISGTPTAAGTASFTVQASDAGADSDQKPLSISINPSGGGGGGGGGEGWTTVAVGTSNDLYGVDFAGAKGWIVGLSQTIVHTSDGGSSWAPQTSGFYTATTYTGQGDAHILSPPPVWGTYHLLDVHALDANTIWISSAGPPQAPSGGYGSSALSGVFVSTNGGVSWTRVVMATNFQLWGVSGVSGSAARVASIGSSSHPDSDIFTITGTQDVDRFPMTWEALYDVQMLNATTGFAAGAGVFKTTSGSTWSSASAPSGQYRAVCFLDAQTGWAVGDGGKIVKTANGGSSWSSQSSGTAATLWGVSFADPANGWAVGTGGVILRTTDGGSTWSTETSGTTSDLLDVKALSATEAWAVGKSGAVRRRQAGGP